MRIEERKVTVGEVCDGYLNDAEEGVVGYGERLDIRPCYQREFVYKDRQRDEVVRTVMKGLPLNVIYWCKTGGDSYEVLDGQQRTISCASTLTDRFRLTISISITCPRTRREKYSTINCSFTFAMARTPRNLIGSASSISRASN